MRQRRSHRTRYRRSGKCTVCIGQGGNIQARDFSTFSPKAIAGIGQAIVKALGWFLDTAFFSGNGARAPLGVHNSPATITVTKETGQAAATINYTNIAKMFARLHPSAFADSVWVANSKCIPQLLQMSVPGGHRWIRHPGAVGEWRQVPLLTRPCISQRRSRRSGRLAISVCIRSRATSSVCVRTSSWLRARMPSSRRTRPTTAASSAWTDSRSCRRRSRLTTVIRSHPSSSWAQERRPCVRAVRRRDRADDRFDRITGTHPHRHAR